jgi:nucleotide-binding universal stress UspA family protein
LATIIFFTNYFRLVNRMVGGSTMINIKNILYATDFSSHSNQAYFHAVALAEGHGATLTILHVCQSRPVVVAEGMIPAVGMETQDIEYWRRQLQQIRPVNDGIQVRHVILEGSAAEQIIRYAADQGIDLIVMGTHGRTGLERLLMGSVAEQVVRGAPCSVLVVKMPKRIPAAQPAQSAASGMPTAAPAMQGTSLVR